jgi:hypothetical protein
MGLRPSVPLIAGSLFLVTVGLPTLNGSFSRIWGVRIPPGVQGRAVAVISVTSWSTQPIAYLAAGPLGDRFFRPLLVEGGPLANTFIGQVLGTGPGRGIGLLLVIGGVMLLALTAIAALSPTFAAVEESIAPIVKSRHRGPGSRAGARRRRQAPPRARPPRRCPHPRNASRGRAGVTRRPPGSTREAVVHPDPEKRDERTEEQGQTEKGRITISHYSCGSSCTHPEIE